MFCSILLLGHNIIGTELMAGFCRFGLVFQAEYQLFPAHRFPFYLKVPQPDADGDEFAREYDPAVFK